MSPLRVFLVDDHALLRAGLRALLERRETIEVVVQVNGRVRERLHVPPDTPDDELVALARASERVQTYLDGGEVTRTMVVPGKLVSFDT